MTPEEIQPTFGQCIRALRTASNMSRRALGEAAGLTRDQVYDIEERPRGDIGVMTLIRVADALGVTPADLVPELATGETAQLAAARRQLADIEEILNRNGATA